jgi:hypothetical protein
MPGEGLGRYRLMDDLISRAAAIEAFDDERVDRYYGDVSPESVIRVIESIPAVDAVSVVRCRDCKYGKLCFDANGQGLIQCTNPYYPASFAETWPFDLDWYCAGGERREGE